MEITKNNFKKILLLNIILVFIYVPVELISSIFTNYDINFEYSYLRNFESHIGQCARVPGAACTTPKCTGRSPFRAIFSVFFQEALDRVCKSDLVGWFLFPDSFSNMTNNRLAN